MSEKPTSPTGVPHTTGGSVFTNEELRALTDPKPIEIQESPSRPLRLTCQDGTVLDIVPKPMSSEAIQQVAQIAAGMKGSRVSSEDMVAAAKEILDLYLHPADAESVWSRCRPKTVLQVVEALSEAAAE